MVAALGDGDTGRLAELMDTQRADSEHQLNLMLRAGSASASLGELNPASTARKTWRVAWTMR
jgi:hypothetical protein